MDNRNGVDLSKKMTSNSAQPTQMGYYDSEGEFYPGRTSPEIQVDNSGFTQINPQPVQQMTQQPNITQGYVPNMNVQNVQNVGGYVNPNGLTKFCKFCAATIPMDAVVCTVCGRQVEMLQQAPAPNIYVTNNGGNAYSVNNVNNAPPGKKANDKIVALLLCIFFGYLGAHKFYEKRIGMGILYLLTFGLLGIGWLIDIIAIITKPNPYYT